MGNLLEKAVELSSFVLEKTCNSRIHLSGYRRMLDLQRFLRGGRSKQQRPLIVLTQELLGFDKLHASDIVCKLLFSQRFLRLRERSGE